MVIASNMKAKEIKTNLLVKKYLKTIRPYLSEIINNHKTPKNLEVHPSNEVFDYETQYLEWKI